MFSLQRGQQLSFLPNAQTSGTMPSLRTCPFLSSSSPHNWEWWRGEWSAKATVTLLSLSQLFVISQSGPTPLWGTLAVQLLNKHCGILCFFLCSGSFPARPEKNNSISHSLSTVWATFYRCAKCASQLLAASGESCMTLLKKTETLRWMVRHTKHETLTSVAMTAIV